MKQKEQQLALLVQAWLESQGWDCYPEAQFRSRGPRADIVAIKPPLLWVIETKTSMSLQLLEQAVRWQSAGALYVSVAVPRPKIDFDKKLVWHSKVVDGYCRSEGLGLILTDRFDDTVREAIEPKLLRRNYERSKYLLAGLDNHMKQSIPGSQSTSGFSTPHQRTLKNVLQYVETQGQCTLDDILKNVSTHFRVRAKARRYVINHLCRHPKISYQHQGYNIEFTWHCNIAERLQQSLAED